jgi:hypothetical protein
MYTINTRFTPLFLCPNQTQYHYSQPLYQILALVTTAAATARHKTTRLPSSFASTTNDQPNSSTHHSTYPAAYFTQDEYPGTHPQATPHLLPPHQESFAHDTAPTEANVSASPHHPAAFTLGCAAPRSLALLVRAPRARIM